MRIGYNTNGLTHHSLPAAIELLADLGYQSVAISLDHACLNPYDSQHRQQLDATAQLLSDHKLHSVVETGARYLLDPRHKHHPTLMSPREAGRPRRVEFLRRAIDAAAALGSDCVSLWSGIVPPDTTSEAAWRRLIEGLHAVMDYADRRDVLLGFEPEPGMWIDTMDRFAELRERLARDSLRLTLDIGHLHCQGEAPIGEVIRRWGELLVNVHIEDMCVGVHEHLMFGEGEIDFPPILAALEEVGYDNGLHVELSRHSHVGPMAAKRALSFLEPLLARPA